MEAHIVLIPKPEKDHTICGNFQPISLTNIDLSLYSKIIANRFTAILPAHINLDQTGFTMGREARDNTIKTCILVEYAQKTAIPACLLSVDDEKAFDRVEWRFLREALIQFGKGPRMLHRIMVLYSNPRAKIRMNGMLSDYLKISNGTRQGCPLPPDSYLPIVMEHLTTAIRNNRDIQGIKVKGKEYKMSVYADDLLTYVTNPIMTIPNLVKEFKRFGNLINFKVNYDKSEMLNIYLPNKEQELLQINFPFKWQKVAIKYLGEYIPTDLTKLQEFNYSPMIRKILKLLPKYDKLVHSWMGRINTVKMDALPKLLY